MSDGNPLISIITTCKDRLHHLQQTLPEMVSQSFSEVIVVDYGCTQGTAEWVRANHPSVHVVTVSDDPIFCISRARNLGAEKSRSKFLLFADADIRIRGDLGDWIVKNARPECYYNAPPPMHSNVLGTLVCAKKSFAEIGGFDEAYRGWGGEDWDIRAALDLAKIECASFPESYLVPIEHSDAERQLGVQKGGMDNTVQAARTHLIYRTIKYDIAKITLQPPDLQTRTRLMELVKSTMRKQDRSAQPAEEAITITLPLNEVQSKSGIGRFLVYKLNPLLGPRK